MSGQPLPDYYTHFIGALHRGGHVDTVYAWGLTRVTYILKA